MVYLLCTNYVQPFKSNPDLYVFCAIQQVQGLYPVIRLFRYGLPCSVVPLYLYVSLAYRHAIMALLVWHVNLDSHMSMVMGLNPADDNM